MGIRGTGIAGLMMNVIIFIIQHIWAHFFIDDIGDALKWPGLSCITKDGIKSFMSLAIPSTLLMCLDWWAFELLLIICGLFGVLQQSSQIILMNIAGLFYRVG